MLLCTKSGALSFLSTLSLRRATDMAILGKEAKKFLSTLSLRRATLCAHRLRPGSGHFYPRSPCGERPFTYWIAESNQNFYPRSPCGERPKSGDTWDMIAKISIHALLAESDSWTVQIPCRPGISIHALLAESDFGSRIPFGKAPYFYPRSPCGERPVWLELEPMRRYFYPRSPCGERPWVHPDGGAALHISIHALLAESD